MPEFASTNSRREGEITLLKFETAVVSKESEEDASAARMRPRHFVPQKTS
jgi:hypothetical protein